MTIKHLVISGGGVVGLVEYGALKELTKKKIINYENIETIYCTSIGSIVGLIFLLNLDYELIDNYLIKRPWEKLINFKANNYLNIFYSKGLIDENIFIKIIEPLLKLKNLSNNITLEELYNIYKIEFNFVTSNIHKFEKIIINYKNYPNLKLYKAIHMTCSIPIIITPVYYNNEYYLDGGIFTNCPILDCIKNNNCNENEILAFINDKKISIDLSNNYYSINNYNYSDENIDNNSNLLSFLLFILKKLLSNIAKIETENTLIIKNTIHISLTPLAIDYKYWYYCIKNLEERKYLIDLGIKEAVKFIIDNSNNIIN